MRVIPNGMVSGSTWPALKMVNNATNCIIIGNMNARRTSCGTILWRPFMAYMPSGAPSASAIFSAMDGKKKIDPAMAAMKYMTLR